MIGGDKPRVFISYTWLDDVQDGKRVRVEDPRAFELAERLRHEGFDSRLDVYFRDGKYGFKSPERVRGDNRDAWVVWAEQQITESDCVLLFCTQEYAASDPDRGECPGAWCDWHLLDESAKLKTHVPLLWWDWHNIAEGCETEPQKFIPVGNGHYDPQAVPAFVRGATYCNLDSPKEFEGLVRRIRGVYLKSHPRQGVFVSYAHKDDEIWLGTLLTHLDFIKKQGVEIWTDREIAPGKMWHEEIQSALLRAKVAILLVTPDFLNSSYVASDELPNMLEAAQSEGLVIFWIPVRPSSYEHSKIAPFQAAHPPSEPLSRLRGAKRDQAFVTIASRLADALGIKKAN